MKKRLRCISLTLAFMMSISTLAFAGEVDKKKKELNNSQNKMDDLKGKISDVKDEKQDVLAQLKKLESQAAAVQNDINSLDNKIASKQAEIKQTNKNLESAVADYNSQKDTYDQRVRAMYMNGPSGYLAILLDAENFSDFISRADITKKVMEYDINLLKGMKEKQDKIEAARNKLTAENDQLVKLEQDAKGKKSEICSINSEKKSYYDKLERDQKSYEVAFAEQERASKQLEKEIQSILARSSSANRSSSRGAGSVTYSGDKGGILRVSDIGRMPQVTSYYGYRYHPVLHVNKLHTGVDIGVPTGTPVYAMADGVVIVAGYNGAYGNVVVISHGGDLTSLYGHNSQILVSVGQNVKKGQMISKSGSTGFSTGPHLHFEVDNGGQPIDPSPYLIIGQ